MRRRRCSSHPFLSRFPPQGDFVAFMFDNSTLVEEMVLPYLGPRDCVLLAATAAGLQSACRGGDRLWRQFYAHEFGAGPAVLSTKRGDVSSYYELFARKRTRWLYQCGTMVRCTRAERVWVPSRLVDCGVTFFLSVCSPCRQHRRRSAVVAPSHHLACFF